MTKKTNLLVLSAQETAIEQKRRVSLTILYQTAACERIFLAHFAITREA